MIDQVRALLEPVARRALLAIGRAVVNAVDDSGKRQYMQITALAGEDKAEVERLQNYGFTSVPEAGAQAVMVCVGGNRDHPLVVAADDPRYRKSGLQPGEVAVYSRWGDYIHFKRGGGIELYTDTLTIKASSKVRVETPLFDVTGDITDRCDEPDHFSMRGMRTIFNTHTHKENNSGDTDTPTQTMGGGA